MSFSFNARKVPHTKTPFNFNQAPRPKGSFIKPAELFKPGIVAHLDFETRSCAPFGGEGSVTAYQYAQHDSTTVLLGAWALGDEPVEGFCLHRGDPVPERLIDHIKNGGVVVSHNAGFEFYIWNENLRRRFPHLPYLPIEQMDCTAARAAMMALPRSLEKAAATLGLPLEKDSPGAALMRKMSAPLKLTKKQIALHGANAVLWKEDDDSLDRLMDYCIRDVEVERLIDAHVMPMTLNDRDEWILTHNLNHHGFMVDVEFVNKALSLLGPVFDSYDAQLEEITHGAVKKVTALNDLRMWVSDTLKRPVDSLDKGSIARLLADPNTPGDVSLALKLRQEAGKSSVAKYVRFLDLVSPDGRVRESVVHAGATTGRLTGRGVQPQNFPSRGVLPREQANDLIDLVKTHMNSPADADAVRDLVELTYGDVVFCLSSTLRGSIIAPQGKRLFVSDFSSIEGRVGAWLAGETWKIEAFRAYDRGEGPDLYKATAAMLLGCDPADVDKTLRNVLGKITELAFLFGGGAGAYANFANIYNIDMAAYWDPLKSALDSRHIQKAFSNWDYFGAAKARAAGMSKEAWLTAESAKVAWRSKHPNTEQAWSDAEACALAAFKDPGTWFSFADGKCSIKFDHYAERPYLYYRLPSGRVIYKALARLKASTDSAFPKPVIEFYGPLREGNVWGWRTTYSGDIFQSFVQATARDIMYNSWANISKRGFDVVLSVHDELVAEGDEGRPLEEFEAIMSTLPDWAHGCPVSSAGFVSHRYGKDD